MEKDSHRLQKFRSVANVKAIVGLNQNMIWGGGVGENIGKREGAYCCLWLVLRCRLLVPQTEYIASNCVMMNCKTAILASLRHMARNLLYGTEETSRNLSY
jgi:hypothetical protein